MRVSCQVVTLPYRRDWRPALVLVFGMLFVLSLFGGAARADVGKSYGFDVRQPFIDYDAHAPLNVAPGMKIVTTYVAIGNRLGEPLPFDLGTLVLEDENGRVYREHVTPIWTPVLAVGDIGPGEVIGGYVSWLVPFFVWPVVVDYTPPASWGGGVGHGWMVPVFTDVNAGHRYYRQIGQLKFRGAVGGYADGSFRPSAPILRAQFAKMLMHAASPDGTADFSYPTGYLRAADQQGFLPWSGGDGLDSLTRLEAAQAVARVGAGRLAAPPADYRLPFTDVPLSARSDLALLAYNKVIDGTGSTTFAPQAPVSRGQAAKMVARMLDPSSGEGTPVFDRSTMSVGADPVSGR